LNSIIYLLKEHQIEMKYFLAALITVCSLKVYCQPLCSNPGQTVQTAFPVCGSTVFTQLNVPSCTGISTGCTINNNNPYFYKFTVVTSGTLGFLITPINLSSDYDFNLYNVTNAAAVTEIYTTPALFKAGNVSLLPGVTGCAPGGVTTPCSAGNPINSLQNVIAGQKYILMVVNFSGGQAGYTLNFTGGTASITESQPIDFVNATTNCSNSAITIKLNRTIFCNSIAADGSDFSISPAAATIVSATSPACAAGEFSTDSVVLNLSAPLPADTYTITIKNGTDGNTLLGLCNEQIDAGKSVNITTQTPALPPKFLQVSPIACNTSKIKFQINKPVLCSSIEPNGSDFEITGPANITITSATVICSGGPSVTSEIELTTQLPNTVGGNYTLRAKNGIDNNTIIDLCGVQQAVTDNINFTIANEVNADFNYTIGFGCINDTVFFIHPGNGAANWTWDFGDPASGTLNTSTSQNPTHIYTSFGQKNITLTVSNSTCSNTITKQINLNNQISSGFNILPKDSVCLNTPLTFNSTAAGNNLNHQWTFGNSQSSLLQNPPPVNYLQPGNYNVVYTIKNNYNCSLVVQKTVTILPLPSVNFAVSADKICENNSVTFTLLTVNTADTYLWDFGDASNNSTSVNPVHTYKQPGTYNASLITANQFCGTDKKEIPVQVIAYPTVELGNDTTLCPAKSIILTAGTSPSLKYLWSTGQATPAIQFAALQTAQIKVSVTNDICTISDSVFIKVLPSCNIYIPNAFTPNRDGNNDYFKVLNADLTKNFILEIYNRYGQKIFVSNNPLAGWDGTFRGTPSPSGTYIWTLRYIDAGEQILRKGTTLLIR
jgi:gliding motility-associated-like protein